MSDPTPSVACNYEVTGNASASVAPARSPAPSLSLPPDTDADTIRVPSPNAAAAAADENTQSHDSTQILSPQSSISPPLSDGALSAPLSSSSASALSDFSVSASPSPASSSSFSSPTDVTRSSTGNGGGLYVLSSPEPVPVLASSLEAEAAAHGLVAALASVTGPLTARLSSSEETSKQQQEQQAEEEQLLQSQSATVSSAAPSPTDSPAPSDDPALSSASHSASHSSPAATAPTAATASSPSSSSSPPPPSRPDRVLEHVAVYSWDSSPFTHSSHAPSAPAGLDYLTGSALAARLQYRVSASAKTKGDDLSDAHLESFVFPCGLRFETEPRAPTLHSFVLTVATGERQHAFVYTVWRAVPPHVLTVVRLQIGEALLAGEGDDTTALPNALFAPHALVLISNHAFYDGLTTLLKYIGDRFFMRHVPACSYASGASGVPLSDPAEPLNRQLVDELYAAFADMCVERVPWSEMESVANERAPTGKLFQEAVTNMCSLLPLSQEEAEILAIQPLTPANAHLDSMLSPRALSPTAPSPDMLLFQLRAALRLCRSQLAFLLPAAPFDQVPYVEASQVGVLFDSLSVSHVIGVWNAMLAEQPVVVVSADVSKLTPVLSSLTALLYPMRWSFVFIPVLPVALHDLLDAPQAFLIGAHRDLLDRNLLPDSLMSGENQVLVVDLDANELCLSGNLAAMAQRKEQMARGVTIDQLTPLPFPDPFVPNAKLLSSLLSLQGIDVEVVSPLCAFERRVSSMMGGGVGALGSSMLEGMGVNLAPAPLSLSTALGGLNPFKNRGDAAANATSMPASLDGSVAPADEATEESFFDDDLNTETQFPGGGGMDKGAPFRWLPWNLVWRLHDRLCSWLHPLRAQQMEEEELRERNGNAESSAVMSLHAQLTDVSVPRSALTLLASLPPNLPTNCWPVLLPGLVRELRASAGGQSVVSLLRSPSLNSGVVSGLSDPSASSALPYLGNEVLFLTRFQSALERGKRPVLLLSTASFLYSGTDVSDGDDEADEDDQSASMQPPQPPPLPTPAHPMRPGAQGPPRIGKALSFSQSSTPAATPSHRNVTHVESSPLQRLGEALEQSASAAAAPNSTFTRAASATVAVCSSDGAGEDDAFPGVSRASTILPLSAENESPVAAALAAAPASRPAMLSSPSSSSPSPPAAAAAKLVSPFRRKQAALSRLSAPRLGDALLDDSEIDETARVGVGLAGGFDAETHTPLTPLTAASSRGSASGSSTPPMRPSPAPSATVPAGADTIMTLPPSASSTPTHSSTSAQSSPTQASAPSPTVEKAASTMEAEAAAKGEPEIGQLDVNSIPTRGRERSSVILGGPVPSPSARLSQRGSELFSGRPPLLSSTSDEEDEDAENPSSGGSGLHIAVHAPDSDRSSGGVVVPITPSPLSSMSARPSSPPLERDLPLHELASSSSWRSFWPSVTHSELLSLRRAFLSVLVSLLHSHRAFTGFARMDLGAGAIVEEEEAWEVTFADESFLRYVHRDYRAFLGMFLQTQMFRFFTEERLTRENTAAASAAASPSHATSVAHASSSNISTMLAPSSLRASLSNSAANSSPSRPATPTSSNVAAVASTSALVTTAPTHSPSPSLPSGAAGATSPSTHDWFDRLCATKRSRTRVLLTAWGENGKAGILWKCGRKVPTWKERWCELNRNGTILRYYASSPKLTELERNWRDLKRRHRLQPRDAATKEKLNSVAAAREKLRHSLYRGEVKLVAGQTLVRVPTLPRKYVTCWAFEVVTPGRTLLACAPDQPTRDEWILAIRARAAKLTSEHTRAMAGAVPQLESRLQAQLRVLREKNIAALTRSFMENLQRRQQRGIIAAAENKSGSMEGKADTPDERRARLTAAAGDAAGISSPTSAAVAAVSTGAHVGASGGSIAGVSAGAQSAASEAASLARAFLVCEHLRTNLELRKFSTLFRTHSDCFTGREAAHYILHSQLAPRLADAVALCDLMLAQGLILNVSHGSGSRPAFVADAKHHYCFPAVALLHGAGVGSGEEVGDSSGGGVGGTGGESGVAGGGSSTHRVSSAALLPTEEERVIVSRLRDELDVRDRSVGLWRSTVRDCFVARDCIAWLLDRGICANESAALRLATRLVRTAQLLPVQSSLVGGAPNDRDALEACATHQVENNDALYRFHAAVRAQNSSSNLLELEATGTNSSRKSRK